MRSINSINRSDMTDIALGGAFLGTGGGGDPYIGRLMARAQLLISRYIDMLQIE